MDEAIRLKLSGKLSADDRAIARRSLAARRKEDTVPNEPNELQVRVNRSHAAQASHYDEEDGHPITDAEAPLWLDLVASVAVLRSGAEMLDIGAGTGVMTAVLARLDAHVTGVEPSPEMLAKARDRLAAPLANGRITLLQGDAHDASLFGEDRFDLIVCRQAACFFRDPLIAFGNWRKWLRPGGGVLVVEGFWGRGWRDAGLVDELPLSCLQTTSTIPYLMTKAGLAVREVRWLDAVNAAAKASDSAASPRYAVMASKL